MRKIRLGVNIDHVATLRQLRAGLVDYPDVLEAARVAVKAGADQITVHVRGDRRHIQEKDLFDLVKENVAPVNLEMAATPEMTELTLKARPHIVCLVPEKREELTTEGGLDVARNKAAIMSCMKALHRDKIRVSLFIEPDDQQIQAAADIGADAVEFHTGRFALAKKAERPHELEILERAFHRAAELKLAVHAGHGLNYDNVKDIVGLPHVVELNIGHAIICRAVMTGLFKAVEDMKFLVGH